MDNNNKWANTDDEVIIQKSTGELPQNPESNTSRKMGIAMGVVGVVLVIAGVLPMFMGQDTEELQGDSTQTQQEALDPLVALLSGTDAPTASSAPKTSESADPLVALLSESPAVLASATASPKATPVATLESTPEATPQVIAAVETPKPTSEVEKILEKKNVHVGTVDTTGSAFHNAAGLSNTSAKATATPLATATKNLKSSADEKPAITPQTGPETSLFLLGFSFLLTGFWYSRRRS